MHMDPVYLQGHVMNLDLSQNPISRTVTHASLIWKEYWIMAGSELVI